MHTDWIRFLEDEGAPVTDGVAVDADVRSDLSSLGRLRVAGPDAERFLQNQFINDLKNVTPERGQLSGYCTPQGRLVAIFRVHREGDAYELWLQRDTLTPLLDRLTMYRLRSQVDLTDESDAGAAFGCSGPGVIAQLSTWLGDIPDVYGVSRADDLSLTRLPGPHPRFALWGPVDALRSVWTGLAAGTTPVGSGAWELLDIRAGLPQVFPETREAFVPQMANLDLVGGLSYTKGCFPGQEVVARLRYRGELKRRMFRVRTEVATPPEPGAPLFHDDGTGARPAGKVVRAAHDPDGGVEFLAILIIGLIDSGELRLGEENGPPVTLLSLPYEVTADQTS